MPSTSRVRSLVVRSTLAVVVASGVGLATAAHVSTASAGNPVKVLVLNEHGVGSSAAAQPYLTKFVGIAAQLNGWDGASDGRYTTERGSADAYVKSDAPHYGIFSLPAFLATRKQYNLDVVGEAKTNSGGEQYFLVSTSQGDVAGCKGKKLATDHASTPDDRRFIDKVVAAGAFTVGDFTLVETKRFGQAGNKLVNGQSDCALIHDAQLAELQKSAGNVKTVWSSAKFPGMAVVAFPAAPGPEKAAFQPTLPKICPTDAGTCTAVGLLSLQSSNNGAYQAVIQAYGP